MTLLQAAGYPRQRAERVFERESGVPAERVAALPVEGATGHPFTGVPIIAGVAKRKERAPRSKVRGAHKLKESIDCRGDGRDGRKQVRKIFQERTKG
jgi:hypothetical protein